MDYHENARLTLVLRAELARKVVEQGLTLKLAAASFNVSAKTAAKWAGRYRQGGSDALSDRSSRPRRCCRATSSTLVEKVLSLRRLRWNGWRIARELKLSRATVSRILRRAGMNRLASLDPPPPVDLQTGIRRMADWVRTRGPAIPVRFSDIDIREISG